MVCAPYVDGAGEAAHREFVVVVSDIRRKIGGHAVGAHQDFVLILVRHFAVQALARHLVAAVFLGVLHGTVPDGAVFFVGGAAFGQFVQHFPDGAGFVQRGLAEPDVVIHAVFGHVVLKPLHVQRQRKSRDILLQFLKRLFHIDVPVHVCKFLCQHTDIRTLIAVLGERYGVLAPEDLKVADGKALAELEDLVARVVDEKLPCDVIARPVHGGGKAVAQSAAAGVAQMHRTRRVGRNELHIHLFTFAVACAAVVRAGCVGG